MGIKKILWILAIITIIITFLISIITCSIFCAKHELTRKLTYLDANEVNIGLLFDNITFFKLKFSTSSLVTIVFKTDAFIVYSKKGKKNFIGEYNFYWHLGKSEISFEEYKDPKPLVFQRNSSHSLIDVLIKYKLQRE